MFFRFITYNKFKEWRWLDLSFEQRLKAFQKLEKIQSKILERPQCKVYAMDMDPTMNGHYDHDTRTIYLNSEFLYEPNLRYLGMATLFHEGRHAFQYYSCFEKNIFFKWSKAYKWKKNFQGYENAKYNKFSFYSMQPVELDAKRYAIKRLRAFSRRFNSFTFKKTMEILEQELDKERSQARKELGLFYGYKVRKNNERKRRNNGFIDD